MRCISCDTELTDFESTRRYESGNFIDLCNECCSSVKDDGILLLERGDLMTPTDEDFT